MYLTISIIALVSGAYIPANRAAGVVDTEYSPTVIALVVYVYICINCFLTIAPGRIARLQAITYKVSRYHVTIYEMSVVFNKILK